jgi:hypothetical protein
VSQPLNNLAFASSINKEGFQPSILPQSIKNKKVRSTLSSYRDYDAAPPLSTTSIIVESLLLGQPDDMTLLPNGARIDRSGFPQC